MFDHLVNSVRFVYRLKVTVKQGELAASIFGHVSAAPPRPFLFSYWRSLSLPPVVIVLFALNQPQNDALPFEKRNTTIDIFRAVQPPGTRIAITAPPAASAPSSSLL
jgi:hypothetical protein